MDNTELGRRFRDNYVRGVRRLLTAGRLKIDDLARVPSGSKPFRYLLASHHELATPLAMWTYRIAASPQPAQSSLALLVRPPPSGRAELAGLLCSR